MRNQARRFLADESAATAIEYGLICACLFLVIVGAVGTFANNATSMFNKISSNIAGSP
jgi:pilus assembly protein Flp/PilA